MTKEDFFSRYEIDFNNGRLGGGSFGTVYKAYDNLIDQWMAVKIAELKIVDGKEFSLISEFNATSNIPIHRNIAHYESVYQFDMQNGRFDYAVMQYYEEGNLKQLNKETRLSNVEKTEILTGLLSGIDYLHGYQVIHRDIKPSNILISMNTRGIFIPKIADFGLAKLQSMGNDLAMTNSLAGGTLEYSSPEQLFGQNLLMNTDLWSFGVLAFNLFTGEKPFVADDKEAGTETKRSQIYRKIIEAKIPDSIQQCPYPWNKIIERCLIRDPYERAQSARELLTILQKPHLGHRSDAVQDIEGTVIMGSGAIPKKEPEKKVLASEKKQSIQRLRVKSIREKAEKHSKQIVRLEEKLTEQDSLLKHLKTLKEKKIEQHEALNLGTNDRESFASGKYTDEKTKKLLEEQAIILKELAKHKKAKAEAEEALLGKEYSRIMTPQSTEVGEASQHKKTGIERPKKVLSVAPKKGSIVIKSIKKKDADSASVAIPIAQEPDVKVAIEKNRPNTMKRKRGYWLAFLLLALILMLGYFIIWQSPNNEKGATELSQDNGVEELLNHGDIKELEQFVLQFPDDEAINKVKDRLEVLHLEEENEIWAIAIRRRNVTGYEVYIKMYEEGSHHNEARDSLQMILDEMKVLDAQDAWSTLGHDPSAISLYYFIDLFKDSEYADKAKALIED